MPDQTGGTRQAAIIAKNVLTEVLPYMGIFMTEELSEKELKELEEKKLEDTRKYGTPVVKEPSTDPADYGDMGTTPARKSFEKDPETGYYIDPNTNELIDPETWNPVGANYDPIPSE